MRKLKYAPQAAADIEAILNWSANTFGAIAEVRYNALIRQALLDLQMDASRPGVSPLPEYGERVFYYRLDLSRRNVPNAVGRVRISRHLIVF
jgi:plasmid stabilization system protein ParE